MTSSPAGSPVWMDLMTHDVQGARAFYAELFGWAFADQGAAFGHYTLALMDGAPVAGIMSTLWAPGGPTGEPQSPTTWSVYLHADDLDSALAAVAGAGGRIASGPTDVPGQGRQAYVVDPAGAAVGLWQPEGMKGFGREAWRPGAPGTPVWFETLSTDLDAAMAFYEDVAGWEVSWMSGADGEGLRYVTNGAGDRATAGICDAREWLAPGTPSFWRSYIAVADADATARRIVELGGTVQEGPQESPFGRFAQVADPQGAVFMINAA